MAAPKQPQDHKISAAEAEALKTPFEFEGVDGKTYEIPCFNLTDAGLTFGFIRKNRKNETEVIATALEALASEEALEALDAMSLERSGEVMKAWQEAAQADLPK